MLQHPLQYARSYVLSEELFGHRLGRAAIPGLVSHLDSMNALVSLAKATWALEDKGPLSSEVQYAIASQYLAEARQQKAKELLADPSRVLYFRPQLHTAMKFVAMHSKENDPPEPVTGDALHKLGSAAHAATDLIARESQRIRRTLGGQDRVRRISLQLVTGEHMMASRRLLYDLARSKVMYVYLHEEYKDSPPPDYLDIDSAFSDATGIDIPTFLEVGFGFIVNLMRYRKQPGILPEEKDFILFHPSQWFSSSKVEPYQVERMFEVLSMSVDELSRIARQQNSRELGFDFLAMKERPLIQFGQDTFMPISFDFVIEKLTTGIYWIVFDHFLKSEPEGSHLQFSRYNGNLFERYVATMAKAIHFRASKKGRQFFADEIYYVGKNQFRTSDAVLIDSETIILIEATASRMTARRTLAMGVADAFLDDCNKIVFKKAKELDRFAKDLRNGLVSIGDEFIDGNKQIIPLIVAIEGFPKMPMIDRYIYEELKRQDVLTSEFISSLGILAADELEDVARDDSIELKDILATWQSDSRFPSIDLGTLISELMETEQLETSEWWKNNVGRVFDEASERIFGKPLAGIAELAASDH